MNEFQAKNVYLLIKSAFSISLDDNTSSLILNTSINDMKNTKN